MAMTSLRRHYVTEKRHQNNVTIFFCFGPLPIKISGYASDGDVTSIPSLSQNEEGLKKLEQKPLYLTFSIKGIVWKSSQQTCLFCKSLTKALKDLNG